MYIIRTYPRPKSGSTSVRFKSRVPHIRNYCLRRKFLFTQELIALTLDQIREHERAVQEACRAHHSNQFLCKLQTIPIDSCVHKNFLCK